MSEELENDLEALETQDLETEGTEELSGAEDANLSDSSEQPTDQEILDWTQDKRYGSMWKQDPNQLYNSYKSIEKEHTPIKQTISKYGYKDPDSLSKALEEYKTLSDPNNEKNVFYNTMNALANHEKYSDRFTKFFGELQKEMMIESLPPEYRQLPEAIQAEHLKNQQVIQSMQAQLKQIEDDKQAVIQKEQFEKQVAEIQGTMETQVGDIVKYVEKNNLDVDISEFLARMDEEEVPAKLWFRYFKSEAHESILEKVKKQEAHNVLSNSRFNNKASIGSSQNVNPSGGGKLGLRDAVRNALSKK